MNKTERIPYMGGDPVKCPRCSNIVKNRYCDFCGLDLSLVYYREKQLDEQNDCLNKQQNQPQAINQQPFNQSYQQPFSQQPYNHPQYTHPQYAPPSNSQSPYGYQQPYMYTYIPKKQNKGWLIALIVAAALVSMFILFKFSGNFFIGLNQGFTKGYNDADKIFNPHAQQEIHLPGGVSAEEYSKLKVGMSYAQISSIIGGDGVLSNTGENIKGETFYTYGWAGENNAEAIVYITITNDKVTDISLEGEL